MAPFWASERSPAAGAGRGAAIAASVAGGIALPVVTTVSRVGTICAAAAIVVRAVSRSASNDGHRNDGRCNLVLLLDESLRSPKAQLKFPG
jgi:hypothetical protein